MVIVPTEDKEVLLLEVICELTVLPVLTVVLLATIDVEDVPRDGRLRAVTFAVVFAAVEDFCPLVPLLMLGIVLESLAMSDELSLLPFPMPCQAGWALGAELRTVRMAGAVVGIVAGEVAVVFKGKDKDAPPLELICEPAVLPALTVALFAPKDIEDGRGDCRLRAVTFAIVFAAVESFCPLVLVLRIPPESLAASGESTVWLFSTR